MQSSQVALITGCSSGIGEATARRLIQDGWIVWATARKEESLGALKAAGALTAALDVLDEASMQRVVAQIEAEHGAVGALINNAGYSLSGALETLPMDAVRKQFETTVFGLLRLTQLVLPGMRRAGRGRIVNIGSMGGRFTFPGGGAYHASKHAVEALSDALRFEVKGFGVDVILLEPGIIRTGFAEAALQAMPEKAKENDDPYAAFNAAVAKATEEVYKTGPLNALGGEPSDVAEVVSRALQARKPKARYTVTASASVLLGLRATLSDAGWDRLLAGSFPRPGGRASA